MGNGLGFSSEKPAFGLPGGGLGPDNRILLYGGDSWKIKPNLTVNFGLRYVHDTGRTDSDLAPIPCSQLDPGLAAPLAAAGTPCNGNILDLFGPGLGNRIRTPAHNFSPTAGFAWDPTGSGKTVIRAGAGIYFENSIFNNNLFNRPPHLAQGLFFGTAVPCAGGPTGFTLPGGGAIPANLDPAILCGQPIVPDGKQSCGSLQQPVVHRQYAGGGCQHNRQQYVCAELSNAALSSDELRF
jgi:hypothetical protein